MSSVSRWSHACHRTLMGAWKQPHTREQTTLSTRNRQWKTHSPLATRETLSPLITTTPLAPVRCFSTSSSSSLHSSPTATDAELSLFATQPHLSDFVIVHLAIGCNIGDRPANIAECLRRLFPVEFASFLQLTNTSFLYETTAMYETNQPNFLNAVLEIKTKLLPFDLLEYIKKIECEMGRDFKTKRYGPRPIDIDILFYSNLQFDSSTLTIPHPRWHERKFVLLPLKDLMKYKRWDGRDLHTYDQLQWHEQLKKAQPLPFSYVPNQVTTESTRNSVLTNLPSCQVYHISAASTWWKQVNDHLHKLDSVDQGEIYRVIPFVMHHFAPVTSKAVSTTTDEPVADVWRWGRVCSGEKDKQAKSLVMGILNVTPDSFSDSVPAFNQHTDHPQACFSPDPTYCFQSFISLHEAGADIIDIGGESTRPGATNIGAEEEKHRVLTILKYIYQHPHKQEVKISLDSYRIETIEECLKKQYIHMVNDVYGTQRHLPSTSFASEKESLEKSASLWKLIKQYQVPYVLMHSRGTPKDMSNDHHCTYDGPAVDVIRQEMEEAIDHCISTGVPRWLIIADPGIGFAKRENEALSLLRDPSRARPFGEFPMLYGPSRKRFITHTIERNERFRQLSRGQLLADSRKLSPPVVDLSQRIFGTAASITACSAGDVDIVRVHDVKQMRATLDIADAIHGRT